MKKKLTLAGRRNSHVYKQFLLAMRLTVFLIVFSVAAVMANTGHSQEAKITLQLKNVTLSDVLNAIEDNSSYYFMLNNKLIDLSKRIDIDVQDKMINDILVLLSEKTGIKYKIYDRQIVLSPGDQQLSDYSVSQQQKSISGKVVDSAGAPLPGVSVVLKGTTNGTITDANGKYLLANISANTTLQFSFVGMKSQEVNVEGKTTINITLADETIGLEEVVAVGYGTQKKENLTGAIATTDTKKLDSRPLTNLGQGLQGLVPGLNASVANGHPGSGATFNVRGYTSINGGDPLILVDGLQMDPNQINPADVESVTVLKDAASAAIYGGRAAYGVILITTKKGMKDTPMNINYSYDYTMTRPTRLPTMVNSLDYITMYREANTTGALSGGVSGSRNFTDLDVEKVKAYMANPIPINSVYIDPADPTSYRYVSNTDWVKVQYPGWAPQQQHNLSLTGGGENTSYRASFGVFDQKGIYKEANSDFKRYNANLALNCKVVSWLDVNATMTLNRMQNDQPANTPLYNIRLEVFGNDRMPLMPVRLPDGHFTSLTLNPIAAIASGGRNKYKSNDIWLTGGFTMKPVTHVSIVGDYTWNAYDYNNKNNTIPYKAYGPPANAADLADPTKAKDLGYYGLSVPSSVSESNSHDWYIAANIYAQYENTFAQKHYVKAMVGYNQEEKHNESFNVYVKNLLNAEYPYIKLNNDTKPIVGSGIGEWALLGTFFRLNYVFDHKFLFEINGRYDGSSRFQKDNRYVFSPSFSAGWAISNEEFFIPLKRLVNNLKFRASYGKLPNQLLSSNYPYIATMPGGTTSYIFGESQQTYVTAPGLVSSNFSWESVSTRNEGVDFGFLDNHLTGSFDYFTRDTKGMIVSGTALPAILGTSAPVQNAADLRTKGFELALNWSDKLSNGLSYSVGLNLSDNKAQITKYDLNPSGNINDYYVGKRIGEIWGYETIGLYKTDDEAAAVNNSKIWGGKWLAGDVQYADLDKNGQISPGKSTLSDPGDLKRIGNNQPRYLYGITANIEYKGFDFSMLAQGVAKRDVMFSNSEAYFWGFTSEWSIPNILNLDYWTPTNTDAYFPRLRFGGGGNYQTQTRYLQNGAYLRMKQLTFGYTLPEHLLQKFKLNKVRVYATGQNLFVITRLSKSFDPEQLDRSVYPLTRGISFGIQIGL